MDGPELRDLRVFLVCAEELHFGRTAERVGLTPGRVSQTIAKLERRFGGRLFDRTSRRVALTAHGARVRDLVGPRYAALLAAVDDATVAGDEIGGPLRIGFYGLSGGPHLAALVESFQRRHPACVVGLVEIALTDPVAKLRRGELDVVTNWLPVTAPGVRIGPRLHTDTRSVALAADHPLAARSELRWDDLADQPVADPLDLPDEMRTAVVPDRTPSGRPLRRTVGVRSVPEVFTAVARGQIVHPTTTGAGQYFGHPGVVMRPLIDGEPLRSVLVVLAGPVSPAVQAFLDWVERHPPEPV